MRWNDVCDPEGRYLAAISGGPDSMALLDLARKKGLDLTVIHVNSHLETSDRDEAKVIAYCDQYRIPYLREDEYYPGGVNFEAWARECRYGHFKKYIEQLGLDGVLIGHNEDDLIETYLMQKEKKAGYSSWGLRDAGRVNGFMVYRPLLDCTKEELEDYCRQNGLDYGIDSMNLEDGHERNRLRHHTVSLMTPAQRAALREEIREENRKMEEKRAEYRSLYPVLEPFSPERYGALLTETRIALLRQYLEEHSIEEAFHYSDKLLSQWDRLLLSGKNQRICLNKTMCWDLDYGILRLHEAVLPYHYTLETLEYRTMEPFVLSKQGPSVCGVTVKEDDFPLTISPAEAGDAIELRFGTKKLSRFFIDHKIPRYQREQWPVVKNRDGKVILVPGIGCDPQHYDPPYNLYVLYPHKH